MLKCYRQTVLEAKVLLYKKVPVMVNLGNYHFYRDQILYHYSLKGPAAKKEKGGGGVSVIDSLIQH